MKRQIRDFKAREKSGNLETYEATTGDKIDEGNLGLAKTMEINEHRE